MNRVNLSILIMLALLPMTVSAADEQPADMEMLEYLGTFQTTAGRSVDPQLFSKEDNNSKKKESRTEQLKNRNQSRQKDKQPQKGQDDEK